MTTSLQEVAGWRCLQTHGDADLISTYREAVTRVAEFLATDVPSWATAEVLASNPVPCCGAAAFADYLLHAAARAYVPPVPARRSARWPHHIISEES